MIGLPEIAAVLLAALAGWMAWDALRARERANDAMRAACRARGFFFLDDTVSLASLRPVRDDDGRMRLRRVYRFQYSDTGHNRRDGSITFVASTVTDLRLEAGPNGQI